MSKKIAFCLIFAIYFFVLASNDLRGEEYNFDSPMALVEKFYQELFSDKYPKDCAEIFMETKILDKKEISRALKYSQSEDLNMSANEMLWKYLKENKDLFLFKSIKGNNDILLRVGKAYSFGKQLNNELITDGNLSIVLFAKVSQETNRVYKEINLPIHRYQDDYRKGYLINLFGITINGIFIFPDEKITNKEKFVEDLGFLQ